MSDAPKYGEIISHEGNSLRRVIDAPQIDDRSHCTYPYESFSIEKGWPGTKTGPNGGVIVNSPQTEREIISRSKNMAGKPYYRI